MAEPHDLLIIGGGITGAGAARDAARRGLRVCLVEQGDLASGTSSRSSKLVHGGLRYLEKGEISLVFEAVSERRTLMDIAPHLVNPLGFLFPVYEASRRNVLTVNVGMWLYDGLSLFRSPQIHQNLSTAEALALVPVLRSEGLKGAPLYYDCATDDARLTLETAIDAVEHGADVRTYHKVLAFLHDEGGRVVGVRARDELGGGEVEVRAHAVINATGPWTDATRALEGGQIRPRLRPTKGVHVVVDAARLPVQSAVVCFHPRDGRILFAIPWGDRTYIGTTDTDFEGDPGRAAASGEDVRYLIEAANSYFPAVSLTEEDVIATWAGVRPLIAEDGAGDESNVSREHEIAISPQGLITIAGGKLTTYRRMAAEVVDRAVSMLMLLDRLPAGLREARTDREPLPGAIGWPRSDDHEAMADQVAAAGPLDRDVARHLADTYGMRGVDIAARVAAHPELGARLVEGRPEILAQVDHAVERELALRLVDVMVRRTQLFYRDHDQGLGAAERIAAHMARLLGWDQLRIARELATYHDEVSFSRAWKDD